MNSNIDKVSALIFLDDEGFDWCSDLNKTVNLMRKKTIPVIVANTDRAYPAFSKQCFYCYRRYCRNDGECGG